MAIKHDLQWGEILALVYGYMMIHLPGAQELYEDDTHPEFYYGPRREVKKNE